MPGQIAVPTGSRTLVVMRHAKAEPTGPTDFERELAPRGEDDAAATARWLADAGVRPDHALVSAAVRTATTWRCAAAAVGWAATVDLDEGLYAAGADAALDLLRLRPDDAGSVVVVGHNPTMAQLAQLLDDGEGDAESATAVLHGFPTAAAAVFAVEGPWSDVGPGTARLVGFHVGRS